MGEGLLVREDRAPGPRAAIFSFSFYINSLIFFYIGFTQSEHDLMSPAPQVRLLRDPTWSRYLSPRSSPIPSTDIEPARSIFGFCGSIPLPRLFSRYPPHTPSMTISP